MFEDLFNRFGGSGGLGGLGDLKEKLLRLIKGEDICDGCPEAKYSQVTVLAPDEEREWAIINAESERLQKEIEKISKEKEILNSRKKIFMGKIQLHNDELKSKLAIKNGKVLKIECGDNCKGGFPFPPM